MRQCQALKNQEDDAFEASEKRDTVLLQQKWKENGSRFYKKISKVLGIAWVLLTAFLFAMPRPYNVSHVLLFPLLSFVICLKLFLLSWFVRLIIYKPIWKREMTLELHGITHSSAGRRR